MAAKKHEGVRIINGPGNWGLIIDGLAKRDGKNSVFFLTQEGEQEVVITGLKSGWVYFDRFKPNPDLASYEMEVLLGGDFDWDHAWWFEGYSPGMKSIPVWGIYDSHARKGVLLSIYVGNGCEFYKKLP